MTQPNVRIHVGSRWLDASRVYLAAERSPSLAADRAVDAVTARLELLAAGRRIPLAQGPLPIVPLIERLAAALAALIRHAGDADVHHDDVLVLHLRRAGADVELSAPWEQPVAPLLVPLGDLVWALRDATAELLQVSRGLEPSDAGRRFRQRLAAAERAVQVAGRLARHPEDTPAPDLTDVPPATTPEGAPTAPAGTSGAVLPEGSRPHTGAPHTGAPHTGAPHTGAPHTGPDGDPVHLDPLPVAARATTADSLRLLRMRRAWSLRVERVRGDDLLFAGPGALVLHVGGRLDRLDLITGAVTPVIAPAPRLASDAAVSFARPTSGAVFAPDLEPAGESAWLLDDHGEALVVAAGDGGDVVTHRFMDPERPRCAGASPDGRVALVVCGARVLRSRVHRAPLGARGAADGLPHGDASGGAVQERLPAAVTAGRPVVGVVALGAAAILCVETGATGDELVCVAHDADTPAWRVSAGGRVLRVVEDGPNLLVVSCASSDPSSRGRGGGAEAGERVRVSWLDRSSGTPLWAVVLPRIESSPSGATDAGALQAGALQAGALQAGTLRAGASPSGVRAPQLLAAGRPQLDVSWSAAPGAGSGGTLLVRSEAAIAGARHGAQSGVWSLPLEASAGAALATPRGVLIATSAGLQLLPVRGARPEPAWRRPLPAGEPDGAVVLRERNGVVAVLGERLTLLRLSDGEVLDAIDAFWEELVAASLDAAWGLTIVERTEPGVVVVHRVTCGGLLGVVAGGS